MAIAGAVGIVTILAIIFGLTWGDDRNDYY